MNKEIMSSKKVLVCLIIISIVSLGFKLYLTDFSIPLHSDSLAYGLNAIAHTNGDFSQPPYRAIGWSLFLSPFFSFVDSDNFLDYSNLAKSVSIAVSTSTIFLVYGVGRKFFDKRYAIITASLFAFLPHLNHNSTLGLSEPLFILVVLGSFYFLLNTKSKYIVISLILAGLAYWIRLNGIVIFFIISITYLLTFKKSQTFLRNYGIALFFFVLVLSPMLIQKNEQYGDPFHSSYQGTLFSENYEELISNIDTKTQTSAAEYIENAGFLNFINNFILNGIVNSLGILSQLSLPYLFILLPFGIFFSFRAFDQKSKYIKANWIFILSSILSMCVIISIVPEKRFLFFLLPFLILFSVIPIQRVIEYGLSTFSFSRKQKDIFLVGVLLVVIILSGLFTLRYDKMDPILENEKINFANFVLENLHGNTLRDFGGATDYITPQILLNYNNFKDFKIDYWNDKNERKKFDFQEIGVSAKNLDELIIKGEKQQLKYIISNENETVYLKDITQNTSNPPSFFFKCSNKKLYFAKNNKKWIISPSGELLTLSLFHF